MSGNWYTKDLGALMIGYLGQAHAAQTAGANAEVNGIALDKLGVTGGKSPHGAIAFISGRATMASGETLSITANWQHSVSSTQSFADVGTALAATVVLNAAGGALTAQPYRIHMPLIVSECNQYVRTQITPTLSRAGTDTCEVECTVVFFGFQQNPPV